MTAKIAELEARLQADSHNSHKPPSSDGFRKRPALPKPCGRKRGDQPGHRGKTLTMVAHPETTIDCKPAACSCGVSFADTSGAVLERRQVFDLPESTLAVTEYRRIRCQCPVCGKTHDGTFPSHVRAPTQYGAGMLALATLLNTGYMMPFKNIQGIFADLFGYAVNERTLVNANTTSDDSFAPSEAMIRIQVANSPVCHVDETGMRVDGTLHWQHVVSTPSATSLFVHAKRGTQALNSPFSLLPIYRGWAVHDCWASYFKASSCRHALCGAHLLRELTAVAEQGSAWADQMHQLLLSLYRHSGHGAHFVHDPQRWGGLYDRLANALSTRNRLHTAPIRRGKPHAPTVATS